MLLDPWRGQGTPGDPRRSAFRRPRASFTPAQLASQGVLCAEHLCILSESKNLPEVKTAVTRGILFSLGLFHCVSYLLFTSWY